MSRILCRDTKPELTVRRLLYSLGFRYRLHGKGLPGRPDIVLKRQKAVIFIHGCFWHLHDKCRDGTIPKTRTEYWKTKLENNRMRDKRHIISLRRQGWKVLRLWECKIEKSPDKIKEKLQKFLINQHEGVLSP